MLDPREEKKYEVSQRSEGQKKGEVSDTYHGKLLVEIWPKGVESRFPTSCVMQVVQLVAPAAGDFFSSGLFAFLFSSGTTNTQPCVRADQSDARLSGGVESRYRTTPSRDEKKNQTFLFAFFFSAVGCVAVEKGPCTVRRSWQAKELSSPHRDMCATKAQTSRRDSERPMIRGLCLSRKAIRTEKDACHRGYGLLLLGQLLETQEGLDLLTPSFMPVATTPPLWRLARRVLS